MDEIRKIIAQQSFPWVLLALQQDENIKQALSEESFLQLAIQKLGNQPHAWSPAGLCLVSLGIDAKPEEVFINGVQEVIPADIYQKGQALFEETRSPSFSRSLDFQHISLLSLALTQFFLETENGQAFWIALESAFFQHQEFLTVLACMYGFLSQPQSLLQELCNEHTLLSSTPQKRSAAAVHIMLCQPLSQEEQINQWKVFNQLLSNNMQIEIIKTLSTRRPKIAEVLAQYLLDTFPNDFPSAKELSSTSTVITKELDKINTLIEIYRIANLPSLAEKAIRQAEDLTRKLQTRLMAQLTFSSLQDSDPKITLEKVETIETTLDDIAARALVALDWIDKQQYEAAAALLPSTQETNLPESALAKALLAAHEKDAELSHTFSLRALEGFLNKGFPPENMNEARLLMAKHLQQLGEIFLAIPYPLGPCIEEAVQSINLSLQLQTDNPKSLLTLSQAQLINNQSSQALQSALLAHALSPQKETQRVLAQALEANHENESAITYWQEVLALDDPLQLPPDFQADIKDIKSYINCAIKVNHEEWVFQPIHYLLDTSPQDVELHLLLGKAYLAHNKVVNYDDALVAFQQVVTLDPSNQDGWKQLAHTYLQMGNFVDSLESTKKVLGLSPTELTTIQWFAEQALALEQPQEAAEVLQWAVKLYPEAYPLMLQLASIYRKQGLTHQAQETLSTLLSENIHQNQPLLQAADEFLMLKQPQQALQCLQPILSRKDSCTEEEIFTLYYLLGQAHQHLGNASSALESLELAINANPTSLEAYRLLADLSLQLEQPQAAINAFEHILSMKSTDEDAHEHLMEIYRFSGRLDKALEHAHALTNQTNKYNSLIAEFAYNIYDSDYALALIQDVSLTDLRDCCLIAEIALEKGDIEKAVLNSTKLLQATTETIQSFEIPNSIKARVLALHLRLFPEEYKSLSDTFTQLVESLSLETNGGGSNLFDRQMIALAYQTLANFPQAIRVLEDYLAVNPSEPRPYYNQAQIILAQAKHQNICHFLEVSQHAPGERALSYEAQQRFEANIAQAEQRAKSIKNDEIIKQLFTCGITSKDVTQAYLPQDSNLINVPYTENSEQLVQQAITNIKLNPKSSLESALIVKEKMKPDSPLWDALVAKCATAAGEDELAQNALEQALLVWNDEDRWHFWLSNIYQKRADTNSAVKHLEIASSLNPENDEYLLALANIYLKEGTQTEKAIQILEKLAQPQRTDIQTLYAQTLLDSGQAQKALQAFKQIPFIEDGNLKKQIALGIAKAAVITGQYPDALTELESLIDEYPDDISILKTLTEVYLIAKQPIKAVALADSIVNKQENNSEDMVWYANLMLKARLPDKVMDKLRDTIKQHPHYMRLYVLLAEAQMMAGKRKDALATLKYASLAQNSREEDLIAAAEDLISFGEPQAALTCLSRLKKGLFNQNEHNFYPISILKAKACQQMGQFDEALKYLAQISSSTQLKLTASVYYDQDNLSQAADILEQVLQLNPDDLEAHYLALQVKGKMGAYADALSHARALAHSPLNWRIKAAEMAATLLDDDLALQMLSENVYSESNHVEVKAALLKTELLLNQDERILAEEEYHRIPLIMSQMDLSLDEADTMRLKAIESRLFGIEDITDLMRLKVSSPIEQNALLKAIWEREAWDEGLALCESFISKAPRELMGFINLAQGLVLRAERQNLCEQLVIEAHAPGQESTSSNSQEKFTNSMRSVIALLSEINQNENTSSAPQVEQWWVRGQAVFNEVVYPDTLSHLERIASTNPQNLAAFYAAIGRNKAYHILAEQTPATEAVIQKALILLETNTHEALSLLRQYDPNERQSQKQDKPFLLYLTAKAAFLCDEIELAQETIQKALRIWDDEAAWHFLSAQIYLSAENSAKAIEQLALAQSLKPNDDEYSLSYAQICIEQNSSLEQAIQVLEHLLQQQPKHAYAHGLLAKAHSITNNKEAALEHYKVALTSFEIEDEDRIKAMVQDYANIALQLESKHDEVIHTLLGLTLGRAQDTFIWQTLAEIYAAYHQPEDSLQAAHQAVRYNPSVKYYIWFANHALKLNHSEQAIQMLQQGIQKSPQDINLHLTLAKVYHALGETNEAKQAVNHITSISTLSSKEKLDAAQMMVELGETGIAISWLEQLKKNHSAASQEEVFDVLYKLSQAYQQLGDLSTALQASDEALIILPSAQIKVNLHKADIYLQNDDPKSALECLQNVWDMDTENGESHFLAMQIYRLSGQLKKALSHIPKAALYSLKDRLAAAEFAFNLLDEELASNLIETITEEDNEKIEIQIQKECLNIELLIQSQRIPDALQSQQILFNLQQKNHKPLSPALEMRIKALEWRLLPYKEKSIDSYISEDWLQNINYAMENLQFDDNTLQAIAEAAVENGVFNTAIDLMTKVMAHKPIEPRYYFNYARMIILAAEQERLAEALEVKNHRLPYQIIEETMYEKMLNGLKQAEIRTPSENNKEILSRWKLRGKAVFNDNFSLDELALWSSSLQNADEAAALINASFRNGDINTASIAAQQYQQNGIVLSQTALGLMKNHPIQAVEIAIKAIESHAINNYNEPIQDAIVTRTAWFVGNHELAYSYLQNALSLWDDEPVWHRWQAELAYKLGKNDEAQKHIQKMLALQPNHSETVISAAQWYLDNFALPAQAVEILQPLMDENTPNLEAQAFMGEALLSSGRKDEALVYYRKVFESDLVKDVQWRLRISLGLAKAALQSGQASSAVAILEDAAQIAPSDINLLKNLTEAYLKAGLDSSAIQTSQKALSLAPSDVEILAWYAQQNLTLQRPNEALDALSRAVELCPEDTNLQMLLAHTMMKTGKRLEAISIYDQLRLSNVMQLEDILLAAENLINVDETKLALDYLLNTQANSHFISEDDQYQIHLALANVYQHSGELQAGLKAVEHALQIKSEGISEPYKLKAKMYLQLDRPQAALASLEQALAVNPNDEAAESQKLEILKAKGELATALEHAQLMASRSTTSRTLAAAFSYMMLENDITNMLLKEEELSFEHISPDMLLLACLKAETALDDGEIKTATMIHQKLSEGLPHVLASISPILQARFNALSIRLTKRGLLDIPILELLENAFAAISPVGVDDGHKLALAEAALDCLAFDKANLLLKQILASNPPEPRPYLLMAHLLVSQAEWQRLYKTALVKLHAPGEDVLSKENFSVFEIMMHQVYQKTGNLNRQPIQRWWYRGQAIFQEKPDDEILLALSKLSANPEDTAALIIAYGRAGKTALVHPLAKDFPNHIEVQLSWLASIIADETQLDYANAMSLNDTDEVIFAPLMHALLAQAANKVGNKEEAAYLMQDALTIWQDEYQWADFLADRLFELGKIHEGITTLETCMVSNPDQTEMRRKLAQKYFELNQFSSSISHYQIIAQKSIQDVQSRIALAEAHFALGKINEAKQWAEQALALNPNDVYALIENAKIALKAQAFTSAYKYAKAALHVDSHLCEAYILLSKALYALNQPEKALRAIDKAVEYAAAPLQTKLERIKLIRSIQGDEAALPLLFKLSEENPEYSPVMAYLAQFLASLEQNESALQAAQIALQNDNQILETEELASLHFLSGHLYHLAGQLDQAIYHFSETIRLNPHPLEPYIELGITYQERRQHPQAIQMFKQAMQISPNDARAYHQAGLAYKESRDFIGAEKMLQKASILAPQDVRIQRLLGSMAALNLVHQR